MGNMKPLGIRFPKSNPTDGIASNCSARLPPWCKGQSLTVTSSRQKVCLERILKYRIFSAYVPHERVTTIATCDGPYNTITGYRGLPPPSTFTAPNYLVREGS